MNPVFADTAYFIALLNPTDQYHACALELAHNPPGPLVTTSWVLVETGDAFSQPKNRRKFIRLVELLQSTPDIEVIPPSSGQLQAGIRLFGSRPDKGWSLTDCISFIVMQERRLSDALTTDQHFTQAGFRPLMKP
ncbi:type II toxin-antitoxin system VapC family toxin [bacterium]|nr:type II toxin-antitoxin system VapC family toxin [bacterium]